jgi:hypothetical protein
MTAEAAFGFSVLMSFIAFGIVTKLYIWPRLRALPREEALLPWWYRTPSGRWTQLSRSRGRVAQVACGIFCTRGLWRSGERADNAGFRPLAAPHDPLPAAKHGYF